MKIFLDHEPYRQRGGQNAVFEADLSLFIGAGRPVEIYGMKKRIYYPGSYLQSGLSRSQQCPAAFGKKTVKWSSNSKLDARYPSLGRAVIAGVQLTNLVSMPLKKVGKG